MKPILSLKIIVLLNCLIFFNACEKDGNSFVEGHIYEAGTELPLSNIKVKLVQTKNGGNDQYIGTDNTDSKGHFKINYRKGPGYRYYYTIDAKDYVTMTGGKNISKRKTHVKLYAMPRAYARFLLKNNRSEDVFFTILTSYSLAYTEKVPAGSEYRTDLFSMEAYGENPYRWRYTTAKDTSVYFQETLPLNSKTDTVYRTLDVN